MNSGSRITQAETTIISDLTAAAAIHLFAMKRWLIGKDSDAGRDWVQEEKGTTEDEMAGWHHGLDGRESEQTLGDVDGQGGRPGVLRFMGLQRVGHD